ncbi:DUF6443 domain-containing protein [Chitinophaga sp.]|uniref:DUF6443 domain-containing protein n=1 Tax=Chitinophaga sp. TaxID=1869181 RepID=UPI0031CEAD5B
MKTLTDPAVVSGNQDMSAVKQSTEYLDGLGRRLQTVVKAGSPLGKDIVYPVVYDGFGREVMHYMPYISSDADGKFKPDAFTRQSQFLSAQFAGENIFYTEDQLEASPQGRLLRTMPPGNNWGGSGRGTSYQYLLNTNDDNVRIWKFLNDNIPVSTAGNVYGSGQLTKDIVIDESGNIAVEFKDKDGRLILRKTSLTANPVQPYDGWLSTYYVYDIYNNLRFVIPPKAVSLIKDNWIITQQIANELCFQYQYDSKKRMISKKVPGTTFPSEMVYDIRDRLVFTRDGNLKAKNQWLVNFYDDYNRQISTALYNSGSDRSTLQQQMNTVVNTSQQLSNNIPGTDDLILAMHDGTSRYVATNSILLIDGFDAGGDMVAEIDFNATKGDVAVTVSNPLPALNKNQLYFLSYSFYDNYNFLGVLASVPAEMNKLSAGSSPNAEPGAFSNAVNSLVTGTKVRVLNSDRWITTSVYYDQKGRQIQVISDNLNDGKNITSTKYDFAGKVLSTYVHHTNLHSSLSPDTRVLTVFNYDNVGRLTEVRKQHNDDSLKVIVSNKYNEQGLLKEKTLGNSLETLTYDYNIRGWIKGINKEFAATGNGGHYFGTEYHYDNGFNKPQYGGLVSGITWRSKTDNQWRAYGFDYDGANRMMRADFTQNNGSWNTSAGLDFSMVMGDGINPGSAYDANGNILAMRRSGVIGAASKPIDILRYTYATNSNHLISVTDDANDPNSTLGDFKKGTLSGDTDYNYDDNGNLTNDFNRNIPINGIVYNHLNLPETIQVDKKGTIQFVYDAGGTKLRKIVTDNTDGTPKKTITDYMLGFAYENDTLRFYSQEAGRSRMVYKQGQPSKQVYDYFIKDHLGNVRMILTEQSDLNAYIATMESVNSAKEVQLFSNIENTRVSKPVGYPVDDGAGKNEFVSKLSMQGTGKTIGPSLVLKVMAGDTVQIGTKAFYKSNAPVSQKSPAEAEHLLSDLVLAFGGNIAQTSTHGNVGGDNRTPFNTNFYNNDYQKLKEKNAGPAEINRPRAYLNYVLFDDQLKLVEENSGVKQVKREPDQLQTLSVDKTVMKKNGYLYIYTSNEAGQDVFFDNLAVTHATGPVLEETHYYPFGLTMAAISSSALKGGLYPENRLKYGGKELNNREFSDGSGLEWYAYGARDYDVQIGRFMRVDPVTSDFVHLSPYQFAANDPIKNIDLDGLEPVSAIETWEQNIQDRYVYPTGEKAFLIENYWVNVYHGEYNSVYRYYDEKNRRWEDFTPKTQDDYNRQRAKALAEVADGMGITLSTLLTIGGGSGGSLGGFAIGFTRFSVGMGLADGAMQMVYSDKQGLVEKAQDVNFTSVLATAGAKNPLFGAAVASAFDFKLNAMTDNFLLFGKGGGKNMRTFLLETSVTAAVGKYADAGLNHLGINSISAAKTVMAGSLKKSGVYTFQIGAGGLTWSQLGLINNMITDVLKDKAKVNAQDKTGK